MNAVKGLTMAMRQFPVFAAVLALSCSQAIASDKSKWEAAQIAGTIVNTLWECKEFIPPEPLADAERQVPEILVAGGFTEAEAATGAPNLIRNVERWMPGDPPMDKLQCEKVLAWQRSAPDWKKQLKADQ